MQKGLSLYAKIQLDLGAVISAYSSRQQMLSQCSSAAGLAGQRVAQANQASCAAGKAGPPNHNKRFPQYQATQAETAVKPAGQTSQAKCASGQAGLQNQNKVFLVSVRCPSFSDEKFAFFRKNFQHHYAT
jgi:hypothetical protein